MINNLSEIEEKSVLRDKLFNKLSEEKEGITLRELYENTKNITDTFTQLKNIMIEESGTYDKFDQIEEVSLINVEDKSLLFIKTSPTTYYIIDFISNTVLDNSYKFLFDKNFFIEHFKEKEDSLDYDRFYYFEEYNGNIERIKDFYIFNREILELKDSNIIYRVEEKKASLTLFYDLISGNCQLNFYQENQFLYEQLYLKRGLIPSSMQDATNKIGKEKMTEMFDEIPNIKIPYTILNKYNIYIQKNKLKEIQKRR